MGGGAVITNGVTVPTGTLTANGSGVTNLSQTAIPLVRQALGVPALGNYETNIFANGPLGDKVTNLLFSSWTVDPQPFRAATLTNIWVDLWLYVTNPAPVVDLGLWLMLETNGITVVSTNNTTFSNHCVVSSALGTNLLHIAVPFFVQSNVLTNTYDMSVVISNNTTATNFSVLGISAVTNAP